jgi:hypothetical protein
VASRGAFSKAGRGMLAGDVISELSSAFDHVLDLGET